MSSKRALARRLHAVAGFDDPDPDREQYVTPTELAATLVHTADLQGDIAGKHVVDLGCGTGMLALAAACRAPACVVGIDIDPAALSTARENEDSLDLSTPVSWVRADATRPPLDNDAPWTVLMNPPFGAQSGNEHADRRFLDAVSDIAAVSYSIHNQGSQSFVESFATDAGGDVTHAFAASFEVPHTFDFHTEASRTLDVEVFRIEWV